MASRIDYAALLAELEARRADIDAAILAIKALPWLADPAPNPSPAVTKVVAEPMPIAIRVPQPGDLDYEDTSQGGK